MIDINSPPDHCVYDPGRAQLHRRALQLMQPNLGIDYLDGVESALGVCPLGGDEVACDFEQPLEELHRGCS